MIKKRENKLIKNITRMEKEQISTTLIIGFILHLRNIFL